MKIDLETGKFFDAGTSAEILFVDDDHAREFCRIGQGAACCRYLCRSSEGWSCEKQTVLGRELDRRVLAGGMVAQGINCEGRASR